MAGAAWPTRRSPDTHPVRGWLIFGLAAGLVAFVAASVYDFLVTLGPALDCTIWHEGIEGGETPGQGLVPMLGLGLLVTGGVMSWRHPSRGVRAWLFLGLGALYVVAIVVIWYTLPPSPYHCTWTP